MHHHQQHHPHQPTQPPEHHQQQHLQRQAAGDHHDHDQIIDQVISLENEFNDNTQGTTPNMMNPDAIMAINNPRQQQTQTQHHQHEIHSQQQPQLMIGDIGLNSGNDGGGLCGLADNNQLSSSSEDLLNLLLEFDREPSAMLGLDTDQQDEKVGIETIRKQLMSCEVQSDQQQQRQHQQNANSMSSIVNHQLSQQQQQHPQQLVSQAPVIQSHHHQQQLPTSNPSSSASQMNTDQNMLHNSYSNVSISPVPVSSSGQQSYHTTQQHHHHVARISQSNQMSIVNNSPSPSWQQPLQSPYSPHSQQQQLNHNNIGTPSQRQGQQPLPMQHPQHPQQHHQNTATSPQMQQLQNHPLQQRSPSQSVSPPATTEPSSVVKKNPLLNAQLINSRAPSSITPTRFVNNQTTNVLNQNPILNAKLSQSPFVTNNSGTIGSPVNPSLNPQSRFMQQSTQQTPNFNYDITQQHQNAQQHAPQQSIHAILYGRGDQLPQQTTNQIFRTTPTPTSIAAGMNDGGRDSLGLLGTTSPSGGLNQQVKQEIRRKVQQPKQQHQTTSLLKQLLSDDNK